MTDTPRFDAYTYSGGRHVIIADGDTGPIVPHTPFEARQLAAKLIAAADVVEGISSASIHRTERQRLASQARAVARADCDPAALRRALEHFASAVITGNSANFIMQELAS